MRRSLLMSIIASFAVLTLCAGQTRIAIPSYQDPGSGQWTAWESPGASSVGIMIVNLNNGDDTQYYSSVDTAIRQTRKKGIFVVGYVYTGYGQRDPNVVHSKVDAVFHNYLVDGIFFDEVPTTCGQPNPFYATNYAYYQELGDYVRRTQTGGRIVILNPGTQPNDDCWMSITNILVTAESSSPSDYQQNYQPEAWFHRYPPERFWHIIYTVPSSQFQEVFALSRQRGAGWLYVTDLGGSNPYAAPPSYWATETATMAQQAIQAPYASFRPQSLDANGNPFPPQVSFRWTAVGGSQWQIFLDTDRNPATGYHDPQSGLVVGADYLLQANGSSATLSRYAGSGSDWKWIEVPTNPHLVILDPGVVLVEANVRALGGTQALDYQIRSLDANGGTLFTCTPEPLSLNSTDYAFDIANHVQN